MHVTNRRTIHVCFIVHRKVFVEVDNTYKIQQKVLVRLHNFSLTKMTLCSSSNLQMQCTGIKIRIDMVEPHEM